MSFYSQLSPHEKQQITKRFDLQQPANKYVVTYIWIDFFGEIRNKTRTLEFEPLIPSDLPIWDACGAISDHCVNADIFLKPVKLFNDPFFPNGNNKLVLCETLKYDKSIAGLPFHS